MALSPAGRLRARVVLAVLVVGGAATLATCDDVPFVGRAASVDHDALRIELKAHGSRLVLGLRKEKKTIPISLRLREGANLTPLSLGRPRESGNVIEAPVLLGADRTAKAGMLRVRALEGDLVRVDLETEGDERARTLAVEAPIEGRPVFVDSVGEFADVGEATGGMLILGEDPLALAVAPPHGSITARLSGTAHVSAPKMIRAFATNDAGADSDVGAPAAAPTRATSTSTSKRVSSLLFVVSARSQAVFGAMSRARAQKTERVRGIVRGATEKTRVYGLDDLGKARVRALVDRDGRFEVDVPKDVNRWYAAVDLSRTSAPVYFEPGVPWELRLDVSAGGELTVRARDADAPEGKEARPLVARLSVRGIEGTLDPSFGPDYRASGAGPLIDARTGEVTTPLPAGRYRVSVTKGIEWSIDSTDVTIEPGSRVVVDLRPRHVVPTPGWFGCDLHVHARPSFDSPVLPEDRVLSLIAAGIDFAVPTEHNLVGDYGPSLEVLGLSGELAWVPGVEVTTYTPRFGHFGVFPYSLDAGVPPYRQTTPAALFAEVHRDPKRILQVNHPRLPKDIGYFEVAGFDPKSPRSYGKARLDFDALEVYNGFDLEHLSRVEAVLEDYYALLEAGRAIVATGSSDAHRIQYQWAGYPRTMVQLPEDTPLSPDGLPQDGMVLVEALKRGHAFVTSGPMLHVRARRSGDSASVGPGEELRRATRAGAVSRSVEVSVRVDAAPWVDVTEISLVVNGRVHSTMPVASRPTVTGPELGTLAEAQERTMRARVSMAVPDHARWIMVLARGARRVDDVLAFMPYVPFAFTNPIWIR